MAVATRASYRGAIRLDVPSYDIDALHDEILSLAQTWEELGNGNNWSALVLEKDGNPLVPGYEEGTMVHQLARGFGSHIRRVAVARLGPGGWIKPHRDINGAVLAGMCRFHLPIVSDPAVRFLAGGRWHYLEPGAAWYLDTSYRHAVKNDSTIDRIHVIVDVDAKHVRPGLLPHEGVRDQFHKAAYVLFALGRGVMLLRRPTELWQRLKQVARVARGRSATA